MKTERLYNHRTLIEALLLGNARCPFFGLSFNLMLYAVASTTLQSERKKFLKLFFGRDFFIL